MLANPPLLSPACAQLDKSDKTRPFLMYNLESQAGSVADAVAATRLRILRSFFRLGFNGDGDDGGTVCRRRGCD